MVEGFETRKDEAAADGGALPAFQRRGDWDNPSGDEPSVPIIYEPA